MKKSLFFLAVITILFSLSPWAVLAETATTVDLNPNYNIRATGIEGSAGFILGPSWNNADFNGDGIMDMDLSYYFGGLRGHYLISGTYFQSITAKGQSYDFSNTNNYIARILDGSSPGQARSTFGDFDGNGKADLAIPSTNPDTNKPSLYFIFDSKLRSYTGTGNLIDLRTDLSAFNLRIDYPTTSSGIDNVKVGDMTNDGKDDIYSGDPFASPNCANCGDVYGFEGSMLTPYASLSGQIATISGSANFSKHYLHAGDGGTSNLGAGMTLADVNGDGKLEFMVYTPDSDPLSRGNEGQMFLISNDLYNQTSGTGNTITIDNNNYTYTFIGASGGDHLGGALIQAADFNNDGQIEIAMGASGSDANGLSNSGSVYIVPSSVFTPLTGVEHDIDMAINTNWSLRIDGPVGGANHQGLGIAGKSADYDGDGKTDLLTNTLGTDYNGRTDSGSVYVFRNGFVPTSGFGSTINLATDNNFMIRFDGVQAADKTGGSLAYTTADIMSTYDLNNDGQTDFIFGTAFRYKTSFVFNFPATISVQSNSTVADTSPNFSGTVNALASATRVGGVQYQVSGGGWNDCTADDKSFDSYLENFTCEVTNLTNGNSYSVAIRAYDEARSYLLSPRYANFSFKVDTSSGGGGGNSSSADNQPTNYTLSRNAGPGLVESSQWIPSSSDQGATGSVYIPESASAIDLLVKVDDTAFDSTSLDLPAPAKQGFTLFSNFLVVSARSSFNGYPVLKTDNPFSILLSYDPLKLGKLSPKSLKIAYYDPIVKRWKLLNRPIVIDYQKHTLATTTTLFTTYAIVYPTFIQGSPVLGVSTGDGVKSAGDSPSLISGEEAKVVVPPPNVQKELKPKNPSQSCFLFICW